MKINRKSQYINAVRYEFYLYSRETFDADTRSEYGENNLRDRPAWVNTTNMSLGTVRVGDNRYAWKAGPFLCDENGNPDIGPFYKDAYLKAVRADTQQGPTQGPFPNGYRVYAIAECECGRRLTLSRFTNACRCGLMYNQSGQCLAAVSQWGEETGEHWTECF